MTQILKILFHVLPFSRDPLIVLQLVRARLSIRYRTNSTSFRSENVHANCYALNSGRFLLLVVVDWISNCQNFGLTVSWAALIKMFSPFGKIVAEDFLWHTRGPKRGEPRGFAFIQYSTKEEAKLAKEKMHGKLACGRPLVVRLASEKYLVESAEKLSKGVGDSHKTNLSGSSSGQMSRTAKIAAIKNKLKALEEDSSIAKKQKLAECVSTSESLDRPSGKR
ncbi:hypothetical protein SO802_024265 [Lithocarpus litseifolius]|uniref:RRM domain-containing protein n=1 Tax=Lithocarpus litseifolius TaxID=425828 RepID=A0AAW2CB63_9ROSI